MTDTHANEKINAKKELKGNSHKGGDAPLEVQQKIIDIISEEARKLQFSNRDIAYYIAIVKRESGSNQMPQIVNQVRLSEFTKLQKNICCK